MPGHIVALGGGGFSVEPGNSLLDDFILSLSRRKPARVCFIPTASADSATYLVRFYRAFSGRSVPTDLTIFDPPSLPRRPARTADLKAFVAAQDIFYVGGGSTANLLSLWRTHGLDRLLARAWRSGAVLAGISAGMLCWFEDGLTDSFGGYLPLRDGLGLLKGAACPHYDGEPLRQAAFRRMIRRDRVTGYAADDGVGLHFAGRRLFEVVSTSPTARAYRLTVRRGNVVEAPLPTRLLRGTRSPRGG
ncbi:MAG: peptidase E [Planctomycetes bacterium]|nr:peptidase E [Planctomycetota bacterium]